MVHAVSPGENTSQGLEGAHTTGRAQASCAGPSGLIPSPAGSLSTVGGTPSRTGMPSIPDLTPKTEKTLEEVLHFTYCIPHYKSF